MLKLLALALVTSCATTTTVRTDAPPELGHVVGVNQTVTHIKGNPVGGAVVGGLVGALLLPRAPGLGAVAGAGIGAAASSGSGDRVAYHVMVDFDDGVRREFVYTNYDPFLTGDRVVLTRHGLQRY